MGMLALQLRLHAPHLGSLHEVPVHAQVAGREHVGNPALVGHVPLDEVHHPVGVGDVRREQRRVGLLVDDAARSVLDGVDHHDELRVERGLRLRRIAAVFLDERRDGGIGHERCVPRLAGGDRDAGGLQQVLEPGRVHDELTLAEQLLVPEQVEELERLVGLHRRPLGQQPLLGVHFPAGALELVDDPAVDRRPGATPLERDDRIAVEVSQAGRLDRPQHVEQIIGGLRSAVLVVDVLADVPEDVHRHVLALHRPFPAGQAVDLAVDLVLRHVALAGAGDDRVVHGVAEILVERQQPPAGRQGGHGREGHVPHQVRELVLRDQELQRLVGGLPGRHLVDPVDGDAELFERPLVGHVEQLTVEGPARHPPDPDTAIRFHRCGLSAAFREQRHGHGENDQNCGDLSHVGFLPCCEHRLGR